MPALATLPPTDLVSEILLYKRGEKTLSPRPVYIGFFRLESGSDKDVVRAKVARDCVCAQAYLESIC